MEIAIAEQEVYSQYSPDCGRGILLKASTPDSHLACQPLRYVAHASISPPQLLHEPPSRSITTPSTSADTNHVFSTILLIIPNPKQPPLPSRAHSPTHKLGQTRRYLGLQLRRHQGQPPGHLSSFHPKTPPPPPQLNTHQLCTYPGTLVSAPVLPPPPPPPRDIRDKVTTSPKTPCCRTTGTQPACHGTIRES